MVKRVLFGEGGVPADHLRDIALQASDVATRCLEDYDGEGVG